MVSCGVWPDARIVNRVNSQAAWRITHGISGWDAGSRWPRCFWSDSLSTRTWAATVWLARSTAPIAAWAYRGALVSTVRCFRSS